MRAFMRAREGPDEHYRGASPQLQHVPERRHTDGSMVAHPQVPLPCASGSFCFDLNSAFRGEHLGTQ